VTLEDRRHLVPVFPVLETERLILREIGDDEASWYLAHFSRPEIVKGSGDPAPRGIEGAREELERYITGLFRRREGIRWGLVPRDSGELVGSAGLYRWRDEPVRQAYLGYDLAPEHWGHGLMTEAVGAIVGYAFATLRLERIQATVLTDNLRSCATLEHAGFVREALLPGHGEDEHGEPRDELLYVLWAGRPG
jgi:ribosomal-protein-alanine N-acetyltransferase